MLTENDELKSSARSRVGAIGLMQVYPKHWAGALGHKFGTNIRTDSTNLKYGIFILGWVAGRAVHRVDDRDQAWRKALLSYNGCVNGTNTPNCRDYPDAVRRQVQENAKSSCHGGDFDRCVVEPTTLVRSRMRAPWSRATHRLDRLNYNLERACCTAARPLLRSRMREREAGKRRGFH